jgi:hypothetical protein
MAWKVRRSVRFGPLRVNFSKAGIGYSVGVRGARIGKDAKGRLYSQVSIPHTGIYNRQYYKPSPIPALPPAAPAPTQICPRCRSYGAPTATHCAQCGGVLQLIATGSPVRKPSGRAWLLVVLAALLLFSLLRGHIK